MWFRIPNTDYQCDIFISSWNEFETLWTSDKMIVCEKFVSRGLPLVHIDEKFLLYTNIVERMDTIQPFHDIGPIRLNLRSLIANIRAYAVDWKNTLGEILIEKTLKTLKTLQQYMMVRAPIIVKMISNYSWCLHNSKWKSLSFVHFLCIDLLFEGIEEKFKS